MRHHVAGVTELTVIRSILTDKSGPSGTRLVADTVDNGLVVQDLAGGDGSNLVTQAGIHKRTDLAFEHVTIILEAAYVIDKICIGDLTVISAIVIIWTGLDIRNGDKSGRRLETYVCQSHTMYILLVNALD